MVTECSSNPRRLVPRPRAGRGARCGATDQGIRCGNAGSCLSSNAIRQSIAYCVIDNFRDVTPTTDAWTSQTPCASRETDGVTDMPSSPDPRVCSIEAALRVIGEKWSLLIVRELMMGCTRYAEIVHNTGLPRDILTRRLRSLERAGVIYRHQYHDKPVRYDYRLAAAGQDLHGLLVMMRHWGDAHVRKDREGTVAEHHSCAATLEPVLRCADCGQILDTGSVASNCDLRRSELRSADVTRSPSTDTCRLTTAAERAR